MINEKRLEAIYYRLLYRKRIARAYNKKVQLQNLQEEDLVLRKVILIH